MNEKPALKERFKLDGSIDTIYTGGKVRVLPDLSRVFTTLGEEIVISSYETGEQIHTLEGDSEIITSFAVSPDGKYLVSASRSLSIRIWDLDTFKIKKTIKAHDSPVITMEIDETSTLVATGGADSMVKVHSITGGYCTHSFRGHNGVISSLKFFKPPKASVKKQSKGIKADNNLIWLASGANDCLVKLWDLSSSKCLATLSNHGSVIRGLDFTLNGKYLISGSRDKVVNVWDCSKFKLLRSIPVYESIENLAIVPQELKLGFLENTDNRQIFYTGGETGKIKFWDLETGNLIYEQPQTGGKAHSLTDIFCLKDAKLLVTVSDDHNISFYQIANKLHSVKCIVGYTDEIVDVQYIGNYNMAQTHLAVASNSEQIRVYDMKTRGCSIIHGHSDIVIALGTRAFDSTIASGSKDHTARVWKFDSTADPPSARCIAICKGHAEAVGAVALNNDEKDKHLLITGSQDRTIKLWDITPAYNDNLEEPYKPSSVYTFQAHDKDINSITFSPSDKLFATSSQDKTAKIWNTEDGSLKGTLKGHKRGVWSVSFSPTDPVLATSSGDKTIKLWNVKDFSCIRTFEGHTNSVLNVRFLASGQQLMSSASDGLVKLWNIKTSLCIDTLDNHTEKVWALTIRQDEKVVVSGGADSVISLWEDITEEEKEKLQKENEEKILMEQQLSNCLLRKDYVEAINLCINLKFPKKLLQVLFKVAEERDPESESITGLPSVDELFINMKMDKVELLLKYVQEWNTNGKFSSVAQSLLYIILKYHPSEGLIELPNVKENLNALVPYTQRHYNKLDELITNSYLVDYTLAQMDII